MQYVGIQTQQSRNNLRSAFLLFLFPCLVAALLYLACYLLTFMGYKEDMEVEMMPIVNLFVTIYHGDCINLVSDCLLG
jgi:heat shock protein HtpX